LQQASNQQKPESNQKKEQERKKTQHCFIHQQEESRHCLTN